MKTYQHSHQSIEDAAAEVERFTVGQLHWLSRRGSPELRTEARFLADRLPELARQARCQHAVAIAAHPAQAFAPAEVARVEIRHE